MAKSAGTQIKVRAGQVWYCKSLGVSVEAVSVSGTTVKWSDGLISSIDQTLKTMAFVRPVAGKPHYRLIDGERVKQ